MTSKRSTSSRRQAKSTRAAAIDERGVQTSAPGRLSDAIRRSPRAAAQRAASAQIQGSPYVAAQRKQLSGALGPVAQRQGAPGEEELQMKAAREPAQLVKGHSGLDNVKDQIHEGKSKAVQIAQDLYDVDVGSDHDGDFTTGTGTKVKASAKALGYTDEYAGRLAAKNPFAKNEIEGKTGWVDESKRQVESFEFNADVRDRDPRGAGVSIHQLDFENIYRDDGESIFKFNARNPALASFYASDVVEEQRQWIKTKRGVSSPPEINWVTRENVQSKTGGEWRTRNPDWGAMTPDALDDFLKNTENGKSTVSLLQGQNKVITEGEVVKYDGGPEWSVRLKVVDK